MVDATRFWVHGCEQGRVSDGSRLALCQTLSIECPSSIFLWPVYCYSCSLPFVVFCVFVFFFCSHWSLVDVPLISFCPADHVPDWQPRIILGMVEARSVNVKKTTSSWGATCILLIVEYFINFFLFLWKHTPTCFCCPCMMINVLVQLVLSLTIMEFPLSCLVTHIGRVWINRVRLPVLHVVS